MPVLPLAQRARASAREVVPEPASVPQPARGAAVEGRLGVGAAAVAWVEHRPVRP